MSGRLISSRATRLRIHRPDSRSGAGSDRVGPPRRATATRTRLDAARECTAAPRARAPACEVLAEAEYCPPPAALRFGLHGYRVVRSKCRQPQTRPARFVKQCV